MQIWDADQSGELELGEFIMMYALAGVLPPPKVLWCNDDDSMCLLQITSKAKRS